LWPADADCSCRSESPIASVVGIPPILVVGIYGMNFKYMPELNWSWGYPFALVLVAVSIALPLLWFKMKDWM
jgi:magnesium transporter